MYLLLSIICMVIAFYCLRLIYIIIRIPDHSWKKYKEGLDGSGPDEWYDRNVYIDYTSKDGSKSNVGVWKVRKTYTRDINKLFVQGKF